MHPPFSFRSCRKENGPCTVQKKRTLGAELAHKAQVRLNTGAVLADCHQFSGLLPARAGLFPRIGLPRVYTAAVNVGGSRKARPPCPADATWQRKRKEKRGVSQTSKPPPAPRRGQSPSLESAFPACPPRRSTLEVIGKPSLQAPLTLPRCSQAAQAEREAEGIRDLQTPAQPTPRAETFLKSDMLPHRETFFLFHRARRIFFLMSQKENGGCIPAGKAGVVPRPWREKTSPRL